MFIFTLALMFIVVTGIATVTVIGWISALDSALTQDAQQSINKSAEIWILYSV